MWLCQPRAFSCSQILSLKPLNHSEKGDGCGGFCMKSKRANVLRGNMSYPRMCWAAWVSSGWVCSLETDDCLAIALAGSQVTSSKPCTREHWICTAFRAKAVSLQRGSTCIRTQDEVLTYFAFRDTQTPAIMKKLKYHLYCKRSFLGTSYWHLGQRSWDKKALL